MYVFWPLGCMVFCDRDRDRDCHRDRDLDCHRDRDLDYHRDRDCDRDPDGIVKVLHLHFYNSIVSHQNSGVCSKSFDLYITIVFQDFIVTFFKL